MQRQHQKRTDYLASVSNGLEEDSGYQCGLCSKPAPRSYLANSTVIFKKYPLSFLRCRDCPQKIERRCPRCSRIEIRDLVSIIGVSKNPVSVPCDECISVEKKANSRFNKIESDLSDPVKILSTYMPGSEFKTKDPIAYNLMKDNDETIDGRTKRRDVKFLECASNIVIRTIQINPCKSKIWDRRRRRYFRPRVNNQYITGGMVRNYAKSWRTLLADYEMLIHKSKQFTIARIEIDNWKVIGQFGIGNDSQFFYKYDYPIVIHYHLCFEKK